MTTSTRLTSNDTYAHGRNTKWVIAVVFFVLALWNDFFRFGLRGFWTTSDISSIAKIPVTISTPAFLFNNESVEMASESPISDSLLNSSSTRSTNNLSRPISSITSSTDNVTADATLPPCVKPLPVKWEWNYFSRNKNNSQRGKKRLLIGLFAGFDKYAEMLERTAPINKAYAKKWNHDLVVLQGTAYVLPADGKCSPPGRRVTLNKVALLLEALAKRDDYDQLLLLDTDAMIYDFDTDVTALLPDEYMMAAQRVKTSTGVHTWNINAGVMLWNLNHTYTPPVVRGWDQLAQEQINTDKFKGDQRPLHAVLKRGTVENQVWSLWEEFQYGHGTVVKHFIRHPDHRDWNDPKLVSDRDDRIRKAAMEVCERNSPICDQVELIEYSDSSKWEL